MKALGVALLLLVAGCTVGPNFRAPEGPGISQYTAGVQPSQTINAGGVTQHFVQQDQIRQPWWQLFGSPAIDRMVTQALASSPTLAQLKARLVQAQENLNAQTVGLLYPAVDGTLGVRRQQIDPAVLGFPQASRVGPFTLYNVGVNVSYSFDMFGASRRELEGLSAAVDYQRFELEGARLALAGNIVTGVIRQASLRAQISLIEAILAAQTEQLQIEQQRFAIGAIAEVELFNQKALVAQTRASLPPLQAQYQQNIHTLAVYTGSAPARAREDAVELADIHLPQDIPIMMPSEWVRRRPDIRASEALLQQASANIGVATANLFPNITLSASGSLERMRAADIFPKGVNVWSLGANLAQPLFHGGALEAKKRASIAAYDAAEAGYRQTVLQGLQNVADVLRVLESDAWVLSSREEQATQTQRSYDITLQRYRAGGVSELALLDAQGQRREAALEKIRSIGNRYADTAALLQALGGGWSNSAEAGPSPGR